MAGWAPVNKQMISSSQKTYRILAPLLAAIAMVSRVVPAFAQVVGQPAPDFVLRSVSSGNVRLSEYEGQPVLLVFSGYHCGQCARQLEEADHLYRELHDAGLQVLVIVDDVAHVRTRPYPVLLDGDHSVSRNYGIEDLPTVALVDRNRQLRYRSAGFVAAGLLGAQVRQLLAEAAATGVSQ